jgi:hypothetical protein
MSIVASKFHSHFVDTDQFQECAWCGAELIDEQFPNSRGETFCSKSHRDSSNRALKTFLDFQEP